jgi:hypothetical protein
LVHIEYVPTQAATEYFRSVFTDGGRNIDGIVYWSARRPDHRSLVIFATSDDVVPARVDLEAGQLSVFRWRAKKQIELLGSHSKECNSSPELRTIPMGRRMHTHALVPSVWVSDGD